MNLNLDISSLSSVGDSYRKKLNKLGIETIRDLVFYFPYRYDNFGVNSDIAETQEGEIVTIKGQIVDIKNIFTRSGKKIQNARISDGISDIYVTWFNQTYLIKSLPPGTWISVSGKIKLLGKRRTMTAPKYEKIGVGDIDIQNAQTLHTGRLVPIYPETEGLSSKWIRSKIANVLPKVINEINDPLPNNTLGEEKLLDLKTAIEQVHFPEDLNQAKKARERLAFDEFFGLQINALYRQKHWKERKVARLINVKKSDVEEFTKQLPFSLTNAQHNAIEDILKDLSKNSAMNRLLEGDVGSGKTVVAATACFVVYKNKYKSAVMAPTQILATQHFLTLSKLLSPFGVKVALVTSNQSKKEKQASIEADLIVGTHALLHKSLDLQKLALVIVDEQHRFGVGQRAVLAQKTDGFAPHILTMTATPIPRTVALTMYGDLDLSILDQMPKGRLKIKTWVIPRQKRDAAYKWIRERVKETDEQAFIVCPLIETSEAETFKTVKAAKAEFELLKNEIFPDLRLSLLHGKIKSEEKDQTMKEMKEGKIDILVATPVVEVGIDIQNATIMMIEAAERFGLAQLHQLRGRVGRGDKQSYCLLFTDVNTPKTTTRLKALEQNLTGAQLAELDLKMRGPGEIYGTLQSGFPELKIGSYSDLTLVKKAREVAEKLYTTLEKTGNLKDLITPEDKIIAN